MASASRLERLAKLVQTDIDALPVRSPQAEPDAVEDDSDSGGVPLEDPQPPSGFSKQTSTKAPETAPAPNDSQPNNERRFVLLEGAVSSYNMGNKRTSTALPNPSPPLPSIDLNRGDLAATRHHFTPIVALSKYPYKFCDPSHLQDIASAFFDAGKFWMREWDLYYIWDVEPADPLILVRESQFQDLLSEINRHLKLGLRITNSQREDGLVCHFPDHPACLPRYLGRSNSRDQYDNMVQNVPDRDFRAAGEQPHGPPDSGTLDDFKQMMQDLWDVQKNRNKAKKAKQQQDRLARQMSMVDQLRRAQRYLGLRAPDVAGQIAPTAAAQAISPSASSQGSFDHEVVFVCVDVESYERAHHKITEIGVATLDTRDLTDTAPGPDGEAWRKLIKARHFRIQEHRHLVNSEFVQGHPGGFDFGKSIVVSLKEAPSLVAACFQPPFGVHSSNTAEDELVKISLRELDLNERRNLVLLGHDTLSDIRYLQQLGYDPVNVENIIEALDTAKMYQAWRRDSQPTSLGRIMNDFDVAAWKLHNAGNDAVYTVQAMLAVCVREATIRGSPELESMRERDRAARIAAAKHDAESRATEDADSWNASEGTGDGGAPVPLRAPAV